ncbi:MAG: alpha-hydroxy acid oxidase [Desulfobacterales bacterium]|jgi:isopentenyl diphosphate isomerase/L-lactate dehydrogenase-like FMN-dependent dehydrogenase
MGLTEIYQEGKKILRGKEFGWVLNAVETGFILEHDRRILDRYTFRPQYIDGVAPETACRILDVELATPVIMSAMTMPIPAITDNGLMDVALGLKDAGSLMWVGTPIPKNLKELAATGVPLVANAKPFGDRDKIFRALEEIQNAGVTWVGIETDAGQGTKIHDKQVAADCTPLSLQELKDIRKKVSCPLICKGILSRRDAEKCVEAGADGMVISNHGAHTLDYLPHALQVMDEIVEAVGDKIVLIADGGFRRGSDVLKGLAFGASLVGLGRPILYGLAAQGREGVYQLIDEITKEMKRIMSMIGAENPTTLTRAMLIEDP